MLFRWLSAFFLTVFASFSSLYAANTDLCIFYEVPHSTKKLFFKEIIDQAIPGKTAPDHYHVTLMMVENIKPHQAHFNALKARLNSIRDQSLHNAHFTPVFAFELQPAKAVVLEPTNGEKQQFAQMNSLLYSEVMQFNLQHNTSYKVQSYLEPNNYKPHLTIALNKHMNAHALNPQQIIQTVKLKLANYTKTHGSSLDLLQVNQLIPAPAPAPSPIPVPAPHQKKAPQINKRPTIKAKKSPQINKRTTIKAKRGPQINKRPTIKAKRGPQTHRRPRAKAKRIHHVKKRTAIKRRRHPKRRTF